MNHPKGLKKCSGCGYYKGKCFDTLEGHKHTKVKVECICNPHICHYCKLPIHKYRICSNYYNEKDCKIWHVPTYCAWAHKCPDGTKSQLKHAYLIKVEKC